MTDDDLDRMQLCLKVLSEKTPILIHVFEEDCRRSLAALLAVKQKEEKEQEVNWFWKYFRSRNI